MSIQEKSVMHWSGGKDSALCLHKIIQSHPGQVQCLLTAISEKYNRVSMHGVRTELVEKQAQALNLPLIKLLLPESPTMDTYNSLMENALSELVNVGVNYSIFGDIFLEDLRKYREEQMLKVKMKAIFPLWKINSARLLDEFIDQGFKAILVCVNEKHLHRSFAGRLIDKDFIKDLPPGIDPCGENGEYHSFVYDGPIFKSPILFEKGEVDFKNFSPSSDASEKDPSWDTRFWYCDILPKSEGA